MIPNINNENFTFNPNYPPRSANPNLSVLEGDSFSKKKKKQQQKKLLNKAYIISFFTDWCGNGPAGSEFLQMKNALRTIILKVNLD